MTTEQIQQLGINELIATNIPNKENADYFLGSLGLGDYTHLLIFTLNKLVEQKTNTLKNNYFNEKCQPINLIDINDYVLIEEDNENPNTHCKITFKARIEFNNVYLIGNK